MIHCQEGSYLGILQNIVLDSVLIRLFLLLFPVMLWNHRTDIRDPEAFVRHKVMLQIAILIALKPCLHRGGPKEGM